LSKLVRISLEECCQGRKSFKMDLAVSLMEKINEFGNEGLEVLKIWYAV
jgi:hypothetical protein